MPTGVWKMLAVTWDFMDPAYTTTMYINGSAVQSKTVSTDITASNVSTMGRLFAGHEAANTTWLGHCGQVKYFARRLDANEISNEWTKYRLLYGI